MTAPIERVEPELVELFDPELALACEALSLYERAFPEEERGPAGHMAACIRRRAEGKTPPGRLEHFFAAVQARELFGISIVGYYRDPQLGFLRYMAVQPELRGRRLGAWLLQQTVRMLEADARQLNGLPPLGLCWEVERPEMGETPAEQDLRYRRINFYLRNGAVLLEAIDFIAPPMAEGLPPMPYYLMVLPVPGREVAIDAGLLRTAIDTILLYGYLLEPASPYYQHAISSLKG